MSGKRVRTVSFSSDDVEVLTYVPEHDGEATLEADLLLFVQGDSDKAPEAEAVVHCSSYSLRESYLPLPAFMETPISIFITEPY